MKIRKIISAVLAVSMIIGLFPAAIAVSAAEPVVNDGIVFTKSARLKSNGTVDITMEAYTTGAVSNSKVHVPMDIIMVLDVSGSMDDSALHSPRKLAELGISWTSSKNTVYGFKDNDVTYYIDNESGGYTALTYAGYDDGSVYTAKGHKYYKDSENNYYYPKLEDGISTSGRKMDYAEKQFYRNMTHMEILKDGANAFLEEIALKNASLSNTDKKHRVSIVKFATNGYYNGSKSTDNYLDAVVGNDFNSSGYNYTQVVKNLTVVDAAGAAELENAMNNLTAGGATAVDYGLQLAQRVMDERTAAEAEERNEVVIVFTDGDPTYNNGYQASVAGTAVNKALAMKNVGVTVFSIGGADSANSSVLGDNSNQFMHYLSNNFPSAKYSGSTFIPGDGSIENGFYMTPTDDKSLENIFKDIFKQTAELDIELGESAGVIDSISQYFTITGLSLDAQKTNVTTKIAEKTLGGWAEPVPATGTTIDITGNTLTVRGFDFDKNYVSESPRKVSGEDFYGKKLIIDVNITPDYNYIDLHKAELTDGIIPTNVDYASVVNSENEIVITADTPTVLARKVIYMVDGEEYNYFYRLPGANVEVIDDAPVKAGHTFSGWDRSGSFTMPDEDVIIRGTFSKNSHNVTYVFSGVVPTLPEGETTLDYLPNGGASISFKYGETYTIEEKISTEPGTPFEGYIFVGWTPREDSLEVNYDQLSGEYSFEMPDHNVTLIGQFEKRQNIHYKVNHYLETIEEDEFELKETENKTGETEATVYATEKYYEGFTFDSGVTGTKVSGTVAGDGSLELDLYYRRNKHFVYYEIDGITPDGITVPGPFEFAFGEEFSVEDELFAAGYDFVGWYHASDTEHTNISGTDGTMPDRDVHIAGHFIARNDTPYMVKHFFQNVYDNGYTEDESQRKSFTYTTGSNVSVNALSVMGFRLNEAETSSKAAGEGQTFSVYPAPFITAKVAGDGTTVIEFYYDREKYSVTYKFEGNVPSNLIGGEPVDSRLYRYEAEVSGDTTIPQMVMPMGYDEFRGWYIGSVKEENLVTSFDEFGEMVTRFNMPSHNVELIGYFVPSANTPYKIIHYLQDVEGGGYTIASEYTEELSGETLQGVSTLPRQEILDLGFEYREDLSNSEDYIAEDGSTVLELFYDRVYTFRVNYVFEGDVPTNLLGTEPTDENLYCYQQEVEFLEVPAAVAGYDFEGWYLIDQDVELIEGGFEMPSGDVTVYGRFIARGDTVYIVQHYLENSDGTYGDGDGAVGTPKSEESFTATTDTVVSANPVPFEGYEFFEEHTETVKEGTVLGDNSAVFKLYYKRKTVGLYYKFEGVIPSGAPALPNDGNRIDVPYKNDVVIDTMVPDTTVVGYDFVGWESTDVDVSGVSFLMPSHDVILTGRYEPKDNTPYHIRHFRMETDGTYSDVAYETESPIATTGDSFTVYAREYEGFTIDMSQTEAAADGDEVVEVSGEYTTIFSTVLADGTRVVDFYYERNANTVTYIFDGVQPGGIDTETHIETMTSYNQVSVPYGVTVFVAVDLEQTGYTFQGWYSDDPAVGEEDTEFLMPDNAVVLRGKFIARDDIQYKVQHHLQKLNAEESDVLGTSKESDYETKLTDTFIGNGTTGQTVVATVKSYTGFIARADNVISSTISGDGSTVIDIYYDRVTNPVSYHFSGEISGHTDAELPAEETGVPYGAKRSVAGEVACDIGHRHEFTPWESSQVVPENGEFRMPATAVAFYTTAQNKYFVEYDLAGGTGAEGTDYTTEDVFGGTVVSVKAAPSRNRYVFEGWKLEGTETIYNPLDEITVNEDIKLIAQWTYSGGNSGGGGGASGFENFTLTYESNGGTKYEKGHYRPGTTVGINKLPEREGYIFEGWYEDENLTVPTNIVEMNKNITVYASWVKDNGIAGNGYPTPESLNGSDHFAYVVGYPDSTVRPENNITRAEVAAIFFRLLKDGIRDKNLTAENSFVDVENGDWYNQAVSTMAKLGIVMGRNNGRFDPNVFITRAEFAAICARFDLGEFEITDSYTDIQGHWAEEDILRSAARGWIRGYKDGTFRPDQLITRAEAMTMINRVLNRIPETAEDLDEEMTRWSDNSKVEEWYYIAVQEASNSHDCEKKNRIYEKWNAIKQGTDWMKYQ